MSLQGPENSFPYVRTLLDFRKDPLELFQRLDKDFRGICKLRFLPVHAVFISDPSLIKEVLQTKSKAFKKGIQYKELKHTLGNGILVSERETWFKNRKLIQPAFYKKVVVDFLGNMISSSNEIIDEIKDSRGFNAEVELNNYALLVLGKSLFSKNINNKAKEIGDALEIVFSWTNNRVLNIVNFPRNFPTPNNIEYKRAISKIDQIIFDLINQRRSGEVNEHDLIQMFIEVLDEDTGKGMSDLEVRNELMTILLAGTETSALTLSWCLYLISKNVEVENKIKKEIKENIDGKEINAQNLFQLPYLRAVIDETMRLYPPVWAMARQALEKVDIGGYEIGKSWDVIISPYAVHRSPSLWSEPNEFNPDRFLKENKEKLHKYAFFPFGGGPRICIGEHFAILEILTFLVSLYSTGKLEIKTKEEILPNPLVTLKPNVPIKFRFIAD